MAVMMRGKFDFRILFGLAVLVHLAASTNVPTEWKVKLETCSMVRTDGAVPVSRMPSVGNGYLSTVVNSDAVYLAGVYNGPKDHKEHPSHRALVPSYHQVRVSDAVLIDTSLDMEDAIVYQSGAQVVLSYYAHRSIKELLMLEVEIDNTGINSPSHISLNPPNSFSSKDFDTFTVIPHPNAPNIILIESKTLEPEVEGTPVTKLFGVATLIPETLHVPPGGSQSFNFLLVLCSSLNCESIEDASNIYMKSISHSSLLKKAHVEESHALASSTIEVEKNYVLACAINASLYYLRASVSEEWPWSYSPGGLASNDYNGHVFWDTETWMFPPIAILHPKLARSLLQYRIDRQKGASDKAESYNAGYKGLMYPWESAFSGQETCPQYSNKDTTGELEQHISSDIVLAMAQYFRLTQDFEWLKEAWPVIKGVAEFWTSRVKWSSSTNEFVINNVIPPDEYAVNVNNSAYTNAAASLSLRFAIQVASLLGIDSPPEWAKVMMQIRIPFSRALGIHLEYDGYKGEVIKQADVILLGYPLQWPMNQTIRRNNLMYYSARTDSSQGPAMTWAMEAISWLSLNEDELAASKFMQSFSNTKPPFYIWTETPTGGAINFITGAGGFLQGMLNGYGGIRVSSNSLYMDPKLPPDVSKVVLNGITYLGSKLRVEYDDANSKLTLIESGGIPIMFDQFNSTLVQKLKVKEPIEFITTYFSLCPWDGQRLSC